MAPEGGTVNFLKALSMSAMPTDDPKSMRIYRQQELGRIKVILGGSEREQEIEKQEKVGEMDLERAGYLE